MPHQILHYPSQKATIEAAGATQSIAEVITQDCADLLSDKTSWLSQLCNTPMQAVLNDLKTGSVFDAAGKLSADFRKQLGQFTTDEREWFIDDMIQTDGGGSGSLKASVIVAQELLRQVSAEYLRKLVTEFPIHHTSHSGFSGAFSRVLMQTAATRRGELDYTNYNVSELAGVIDSVFERIEELSFSARQKELLEHCRTAIQAIGIIDSTKAREVLSRVCTRASAKLFDDKAYSVPQSSEGGSCYSHDYFDDEYPGDSLRQSRERGNQPRKEISLVDKVHDDIGSKQLINNTERGYFRRPRTPNPKEKEWRTWADYRIKKASFLVGVIGEAGALLDSQTATSYAHTLAQHVRAHNSQFAGTCTAAVGQLLHAVEGMQKIALYYQVTDKVMNRRRGSYGSEDPDFERKGAWKSLGLDEAVKQLSLSELHQEVVLSNYFGESTKPAYAVYLPKLLRESDLKVRKAAFAKVAELINGKQDEEKVRVLSELGLLQDNSFSLMEGKDTRLRLGSAGRQSDLMFSVTQSLESPMYAASVLKAWLIAELSFSNESQRKQHGLTRSEEGFQRIADACIRLQEHVPSSEFDISGEYGTTVAQVVVKKTLSTLEGELGAKQYAIESSIRYARAAMVFRLLPYLPVEERKRVAMITLCQGLSEKAIERRVPEDERANVMQIYRDAVPEVAPEVNLRKLLYYLDSPWIRLGRLNQLFGDSDDSLLAADGEKEPKKEAWFEEGLRLAHQCSSRELAVLLEEGLAHSQELFNLSEREAFHMDGRCRDISSAVQRYDLALRLLEKKGDLVGAIPKTLAETYFEQALSFIPEGLNRIPYYHFEAATYVRAVVSLLGPVLGREAEAMMFEHRAAGLLER